MSVEAAFARAFNAHDLTAMTALLAPAASATLIGSGFPPEQGAGAIREGSFPHLLEGDGLRASVHKHDDRVYVAFRDEDGMLDSLAALDVVDGVIQALRYHTRWHDEAFVEQVARATTSRPDA